MRVQRAYSPSWLFGIGPNQPPPYPSAGPRCCPAYLHLLLPQLQRHHATLVLQLQRVALLLHLGLPWCTPRM